MKDKQRKRKWNVEGGDIFDKVFVDDLLENMNSDKRLFLQEIYHVNEGLEETFERQEKACTKVWKLAIRIYV